MKNMMTTIASCRRGKRHIALRQPLEDRYMVKGDDSTILAVADGHGDERCVRAGFGSRLACAAAMYVLSDPAIGTEALAAEIAARYRRLAERHLVFRPLSEAEVIALDGLDPVCAFGTTLVCARVDQTGTTLAALGDSEIFALSPVGQLLSLPADPDCYANVTSSLCAPDATRSFRVVHYDFPVAALALLTDGYAYRGTAPAELLRLFFAAPLPDRIPEDVLSRGDNGDDQTLIVAADAGLTDTDVFRQGLSAVLKRLENDEEIRRLEEERKEILAYLRLALRPLQDRKGAEWQRLASHVRERLHRLQECEETIAALTPKEKIF